MVGIPFPNTRPCRHPSVWVAKHWRSRSAASSAVSIDLASTDTATKEPTAMTYALPLAGPDPADVDAIREMLDDMTNFQDNDQRRDGRRCLTIGSRSTVTSSSSG